MKQNLKLILYLEKKNRKVLRFSLILEFLFSNTKTYNDNIVGAN